VVEENHKGLVQVFTGNGKGKTTAALGTVIRAAGHGFRIYIVSFMKGDYAQALKELETAGDINPTDENLKMKIYELYKKSFQMQKKAEAIAYTQDALTYLQSDNLISAGDKLKDALRSVVQVAQERIGD